MILVADSGSTKTDWRFLLPQKNKSVHCSSSNEATETIAWTTSGINPYFLTEDEIVALLVNELCLSFKTPGVGLDVSHIREIYFYGAGVATQEKSAMLVSSLKTAFPFARTVESHSDLLGTARGLCGTSPGIVGILGTGSNSCYFDGHEIVDNIPPCGFILGDEGSGAMLGRKLLSAFLKRELPESLCEKLRYDYGLSREIILERVYRQQFPNRFLAQYAKFLADNILVEVVRSIVVQSFEEFFDRNVLKYSRCRDVPVHLAGSIAFYFADLLRQVAHTRRIKLGTIRKSPIDGIVAYHLVEPQL